MLDQHWRPFWSGLTVERQQEYFARWHASGPWREAIASYFDADPAFDVEAEPANPKTILNNGARLARSERLRRAQG